MYTLSDEDRKAILAMQLGECSGPLDRDSYEEVIRRDLPVIPGLDGATTLADRQVLFSAQVERERALFVGRFGTPFGVTEKPQKGAAALPSTAVQTIVCNGVATA